MLHVMILLVSSMLPFTPFTLTGQVTMLSCSHVIMLSCLMVSIGMMRMFVHQWGVGALEAIDIVTRDTPVHIAAEHGYSSFIQTALSFGHNTEIINARHATPLLTACFFGQPRYR
jgi:hypothetical protein